MAQLHEPIRGIPHEEFVRRKAASRRMDRGLRLVALVPWPGWSVWALLAAPMLLTSGLASLQEGAAGALAAPLLLSCLLVLVVVFLMVSDAIALLPRSTRRARWAVMSARPVLRGPRPAFLLLLAVVLTATVVLLTVLMGGSTWDGLGAIVVVAALTSASAAVGSLYAAARSRLLLRRTRP